MEPAAEQQVVMLVKSNLMGEGDAELGHVLMKSFFYALNESADRPKTIFFLNSAVRLTCAGSPVLDHLRSLDEQGVQIMSCGTCLDFYHLKDQLALGGVTNMYSIVEGMMQADKTITL
jgi:selenium metabolism protein YedF